MLTTPFALLAAVALQDGREPADLKVGARVTDNVSADDPETATEILAAGSRAQRLLELRKIRDRTPGDHCTAFTEAPPSHEGATAGSVAPCTQSSPTYPRLLSRSRVSSVAGTISGRFARPSSRQSRSFLFMEATRSGWRSATLIRHSGSAPRS